MFGTSISEYIRMNILRKNNQGVKFHPLRGTCSDINRSTIVQGKGTLYLNTGRFSRAKMYMYIQTEKNTQISVNGSVHVGYGCDIKVFNGGHLELEDCSVNSYSQIRCKHHIRIGKGTRISRNVQIWDDDHHTIVGQKVACNDIVIDKNVWIGAGATILKGVHIGEGSMIAAGAVVTRDIPPHCVAGGIPAKVIKEEFYWEA